MNKNLQDGYSYLRHKENYPLELKGNMHKKATFY